MHLKVSEALKRDNADLPYILLLLGNQLGWEIKPQCTRIQNSKWSTVLYL